MVECTLFTNCGQYLAYVSHSSEKIKIWETETNFIKQEFSPGSLLASPCSSVTWLSLSKDVGKKKRKWMTRTQKILVLGTESGQIYFYNVVEGEVVSSIQAQGAVRGLAASSAGDLYVGCENRVQHWNARQKVLTRKWKCDGPISSMRICEENKILLIAITSEIICWNLEDCTAIKKLSGHKSNIVDMCYSHTYSGEAYLFSAAHDDRLVNVWDLSSSEDNKPVAMFALPDVPLSISSNIAGSGLLTLAAVARRGSLHIYSYQLNGHTPKPLKPKTTVLVTPDGPATKKKTDLIPVVSVRLLAQNMKIAFGFSSLIICDSINPNVSESKLFLVRKDPRRLEKPKEESVNKLKNVKVGGNVEYLGPANIGRSAKRNLESMEEEGKLTMEELMNKMNISSKTQPSGDTLAHLLIQGLNSQDKDILRSVLYTQDEQKIHNTVERLPGQAIFPLLKLLINLIQGRSFVSQIAAKWLQALLRTHISQLLADEKCAAVMSPLISLVETRLNCLGPLCQLRGRLDLILNQANDRIKKQQDGSATAINVEPLLVYQDNDSPLEANCLLESDSENEDEEYNKDMNEYDDLGDDDEEEQNVQNNHIGSDDSGDDDGSDKEENDEMEYSS